MKRISELFILLLIAGMAACFASGCGGGGEVSQLINPPELSGLSDTTPPAKVSGFTGTQDDCSITLSWLNPAASDFAGVIIRRSAAGYPSNPRRDSNDDEAVVYYGTATVFVESGLSANETYYYSAFAYDSAPVPNYSAAANASVTCIYNPFTLVVIPDIQYYSLDYPAIIYNMADWIVNNQEDRNIRFVLQEGDMTHTNSSAEWTNADAAFSLLDGVVPYAIAVGNHDEIGGNTNLFNSTFPVSRFSGLPTFGGVMETGKMNNSYHVFSAGGTEWMIMVLEYNPEDAALEWAAQVAADNPGRRIIILTHAFLYPDDKRSSIGENIWDNFAKLYKNVTFVFNGHYTDDYAARLVSAGDNGNSVYQMFANYQTMLFGGLGYMRLVEIDPAGGVVSVETFSHLQGFWEDDDNEFEYAGVELGQP